MGILKVYWRPGCSFCANLSRHLKKADIQAEYINIWEDTEALQFVLDLKESFVYLCSPLNIFVILLILQQKFHIKTLLSLKQPT